MSVVSRLAICLFSVFQFSFLCVARSDAVSDNPILFVTMVPNPADFGTLAATFGNHIPNPDTAYRGGDLWIRYPDGTLKNLTSTAGYGNAGFQGAGGIAVRDPSVHWDGTKALFSMVVGAPTARYQLVSHKWQIYEITGLGISETPVITKVPNQPSGYNNHSAIYGSDDPIIFISDRPRDDTVLHTYPQRDEYESSPVNTGVWKLVPSTCSLILLDHSPSGDFNPIIDSSGRLIFTRWDHLQRDQQNIGASLGAYNFESEVSTVSIGSAPELFPEARSVNDPDYRSNSNLFTINQFFPWMMNQDGTELETLNHVGRQEIGLYSERSFNDDPNVQEFYGQYSTGANQNKFTIFLHIKEKPTAAGTFLGTSCQEFGTHASGQIISLTGGASVNPDAMTVTNLTHPDTSGSTDNAGPNHSGLYRDPLPLSNGNILVSHTSNTRQDSNIGSSALPLSHYDFRIKPLTLSGSYYIGGAPITSGIAKTVSFWNPDSLTSYSGTLWEMMPVELKARVKPSASTSSLPPIESEIIGALGVNLSDLQTYLKNNNLALVVSRNITMRDRNDRQQPTNLRVKGTTTQSIPKSGKVYDVAHMQFFQGDLVRGYSSGNSNGRRVIPQRMHSVPENVNPAIEGAAKGSVQIAEDGSMAAFVPARRAVTWQMTNDDGSPVVRERYWVTFQPGEVRVCASCHGINTADHTGKTAPTNSPIALTRLLQHWKGLPQSTPVSNPSSDFTMKVKLPLLKPKAKVSFTVTGGQASDKLTLKLAINSKGCTANKVLPKKASRILRGTLPSKSGLALKFSLHKSGTTAAVATKSAQLSGKKGKLSAQSIQTMCKRFMSSLKAS